MKNHIDRGKRTKTAVGARKNDPYKKVHAKCNLKDPKERFKFLIRAFIAEYPRPEGWEYRRYRRWAEACVARAEKVRKYGAIGADIHNWSTTSELGRLRATRSVLRARNLARFKNLELDLPWMD